LAQQGTPHKAQEEKEIGQSLEAMPDFAGRLQSCGVAYYSMDSTCGASEKKFILQAVIYTSLPGC